MEIFEVGLNVFYIILWLQAYRRQEVDYGSFNRYSPHILMCLCAWPMRSGAIRICSLVGVGMARLFHCRDRLGSLHVQAVLSMEYSYSCFYAVGFDKKR